MAICDLHVHSVYSDGTCSVNEILNIAKQTGISAIALTDHNTVDGVKEILTKSKDFGVEAIGGVEISSLYNGKELHIVALFIKEENFAKVEEFLALTNIRKEESNQLLSKNLNNNGYDVSYEEIKANTVGSINRVHFAKELMKKGYVKSVKEAFYDILSEERGLYVPPKKLTALEVIDFIKSINAISVLAHPLVDFTEEELKEFLPLAKSHGLNAIETVYSTYTESEKELAKQIATDFGLLMSGGSDFHGENKPAIKLGVGLGSLNVPYEYVTLLKNKIL